MDNKTSENSKKINQKLESNNQQNQPILENQKIIKDDKNNLNNLQNENNILKNYIMYQNIVDNKYITIKGKLYNYKITKHLNFS